MSKRNTKCHEDEDNLDKYYFNMKLLVGGSSGTQAVRPTLLFCKFDKFYI